MLHFNPLLFVLSSVPQKKKCLSKAVYISVWYKLAKRVTDICVRFVPTQTGSGQNPITARFLAAVSPHATPIILMMFGWEKLLTTLSVFWLNWYGLQSIYICVCTYLYEFDWIGAAYVHTSLLLLARILGVCLFLCTWLPINNQYYRWHLVLTWFYANFGVYFFTLSKAVVR